MALVLAATGLFLYVSFKSDLNRTIDQGLRTRASDILALIQEADSGLKHSRPGQLVRGRESFAQILERNGTVFDATPQAGKKPLLSAAELARATRGTMLVDHSQSAGGDAPTRLLATPTKAQDQRLVVVVGSSLHSRDDALRELKGLLALGGLAALLLSSLAGYGVAAAALSPVESMRRRAATISGADPSQRLPVSPAHDELRRLGETLNEMLARLEAALEHERAFVSDASHELRTPLAIMRAELELALRDSRSVDELQAALRSATEESDRLGRLAEDLLVLARADHGRLPVHREEVRVEELLDRVQRRFAERARASGRTIEVESPDGLILFADPLRLEQALSNLTDNALRHGRGSITLMAAADAGGWLSIEVGDEGEGFPPGFADRAFDRFTRGDAARQRGGAGLGLAIVLAIAQSHGGQAGVSEGPGPGARVWLRLPGRRSEQIDSLSGFPTHGSGVAGVRR
jgi:two-component system, OmpR family, sensor kinase